MKIRISAVTDVGRERTNNEDAFAFCPDMERQDWTLTETNGYLPLGRYGMVAVVADGMGGANAGEVASAIAVAVTKECFQKAVLVDVTKSTNSMRAMMIATMEQINEAIQERVCREPETIGMGTTIVMTWICDGESLVTWCGDSRCYSFTPEAGLKRLTHDHSYVQTLIDRGDITEAEAFTHEDSSVITRCLGDADTPAMPEVQAFSVRAGHLVLLCSDGLCGYSEDREIERVLYESYANTASCRQALLSLCYDKGGQDNITLVVLSFIADCDEAPRMPHLLLLKRRLRRLLRL